MSKEIKDIKNIVLTEIKEGQIKMRPKVYFIAGSVLAVLGVSFLIVTSVFSFSLLWFWIRMQSGLGGGGKVLILMSIFPWWIPVLGVVAIIGSILLLRRYDFSYKKNFKKIIVVLLLSILFGSWLMDVVGFNDVLTRRGPMRDLMRGHMQETNQLFQK